MIFPFDLVCVACLFGSFFPFFRFAVRFEFFDRPLVLAFCWSFFFPDPANIPIAIFYELLWLDLLVIGTYVPPQGSLSTLVCLALVTGFDLSGLPRILPLLFLVLPFAHLASFLERLQRKWQNREATNLMYAARKGDPREFQPKKVIIRSLLVSLARNVLVFLVSFYGCAMIFCFVRQEVSPLPENLSWSVLWTVASIPAVLSVRMVKGYALLASVFCAGVVFLVLRSFLSP